MCGYKSPFADLWLISQIGGDGDRSSTVRSRSLMSEKCLLIAHFFNFVILACSPLTA
jgi:hypothetical protein